MKFRLVRAFQKYILNPIMRPLHGFIPGTALLETVGNKTGERRRTPIGGKLIDNTFWLVSEHGPRSGYVRNIAAEPSVRLRVRGRWRTGAAQPVPADDARKRAMKINFFNSLGVMAFGTNLLTIKIELETLPSARA